MEEDNIIPLQSRKDKDFKPRFTLRRLRFCKHNQVVLDEQNRMVECEQCGGILDPFEYMIGLARKEENILGHLNSLKIDIRFLEEEKARLTNELASIRRQKNKEQKELNFGA